MVDIIAKVFVTASIGMIMLALPPQASAGKGPVVLDAGHGGYDTGLISSGVKEKDLTLTIVKSVKAVLEESEDRDVWLTRKIDQFTSISERRAEANSVAPGMLVSMHLSGSDKVVVYTTWYLRRDTSLSISQYYSVSSAQRRYLYESKALSRALGRVLSAQLDVSVAYRQMPIELLNTIAAPAVLVELPSKGVDYEDRLGEIVAAIVRGIGNYERGQ